MTSTLRWAEFSKQLCFFEATDQVTSKIEIALIVLTAAIASITIAFLLKHIQQFKKQFESKRAARQLLSYFQFKVYGFLLVWIVATLSKCIVNVYAYSQYMSDSSQDQQSHPGLLPLSACFHLGDNYSVFSLLSLMILIPHHWLKYILKGITEESGRTLEINDRKLFLRIFKILGAVRIYMYVRWLYAVGLIAMFIFLLFGKLSHNVDNFWIYLILFDSTVCICFYLFGFYCAELLRRKKLIKMEKEAYRVLRMEYAALVVALLARCFMNGFFYFAQSFYKYEPNENCTDRNPRNVLIRSLFLGFGEPIMHFLPVFIILYIYRPQSSREIFPMEERLLNHTKVDEEVR